MAWKKLTGILVISLSIAATASCKARTFNLSNAQTHTESALDEGEIATFVEGKDGLGEPIERMIYEEQVLHNKDLWPADSFKTDMDPRYVPEARPKFALGYYLVPVEYGTLQSTDSLSEDVKRQIVEEIDGKKYYKLFVHPESRAHYKFLEGVARYRGGKESEFLATPSSSYRSLFVWNRKKASKVFIAKVSLDRNVIGSIDRLVSPREVERSIANQKAFDLIGESKLKDAGVRLFPETAGLLINAARFSQSPEKVGGQLIREIPADVAAGQVRFVSFSSMMSPIARPLLVEESIRASGLSPKQYLKQHLVDGYMRAFNEARLIQSCRSSCLTLIS